MRRFSLIGRLGPDDKGKINLVQSDSDVFEIDFLDGDLRTGFGIGHALDQLASLGLQPSERAIDLVILAALVNAGDTRVSRKLNAQDGWTREIDLYIPVSASAVWTASTKSIESMLRFLSGDRWRVFGPVPVWCRSFDSIMCNKGDELWAQEERMNFARTQCELH